MGSSQQKNYYFDTCTIVDAINHASPHYTNVRQALRQIKAGSVVSEYMEVELKGVLRKSKFNEVKDMLLGEYVRLKRMLRARWIPNDRSIMDLHKIAKRLQKDVRSLCRGSYPKFPDMVHIGICGLKNITSIVSEDWHIYGRTGQGIPFIEIVKEVITRNFYRISNPKHVYTTRQGYLKQEV